MKTVISIHIYDPMQEEDRIIANEVVTLKPRMGASDVTPKRMREFLIRVLYCEMLGHQAEFGYIHAVNMSQQPTLLEKRIGML